MSKSLHFRVGDADHAHGANQVTANGIGDGFEMQCDCLAGLHGAILCPHIVAVIRQDRDRVKSGYSKFDELAERSKGSRVTDPENGYWTLYS